MKRTVLMVGDDPDLRSLVRRSLEELELRVVEAGDGLTAGALSRDLPADLLIADEAIAGTTCIELTRLQAENALLRSELRSLSDSRDGRVGRGDGELELQAVLTRYERLSAEVERAHYETAMRLISAARLKTDELSGHLARISLLAAQLARALDVSEDGVRVLAAAAPLHDIGKIGIPDRVLTKPGPLTSDEWELVKSHTVLGARILSNSSSRLLNAAQEIALTHHESWDGSGYPRGLAGKAIPLFGRIVLLADRYDALRSERPYKPAFDHERTCRILLDGDGRTEPAHFDPAVLEVFDDVSDHFAEIFDTIGDGEGRELPDEWLSSLQQPLLWPGGAETTCGMPAGSSQSRVVHRAGSLCPNELLGRFAGRESDLDKERS